MNRSTAAPANKPCDPSSVGSKRSVLIFKQKSKMLIATRLESSEITGILTLKSHFTDGREGGKVRRIFCMIDEAERAIVVSMKLLSARWSLIVATALRVPESKGAKDPPIIMVAPE